MAAVSSRVLEGPVSALLHSRASSGNSEPLFLKIDRGKENKLQRIAAVALWPSAHTPAGPLEELQQEKVVVSLLPVEPL